jgi:hypothetical protein
MLAHTYRKYQIAVAAAMVAALFVAGTALAHTRIVKGDYAFVLGWLDEPPVVGVKNAALIELSTASDDQPVIGAEGTLTAQLQFGGKTRELVLRPVEGLPGSYAGDFIPTRRGTYTLQLGGKINDQPIDLSGDIEEVGSSDSLAFPEPVNVDLQNSIDALRGQLGTSQTLGTIGLAVGLISLIGVGVLFARRPKRTN